MAVANDKITWLEARRELLASEKAFQLARDDLAMKRRALPPYKLDNAYSFEGKDGPVTLNDLFRGHSQLLIYHFMYHPDWEEGCKSCSFWADSFDGVIPHLAARDVSFAVIARAPLAKLLAYQGRMGWSFPWYSSGGSSFNFDFGVSFQPEEIERKQANYNYRTGGNVGPEMPGVSVFQRNSEDDVLHSYSTYSRGLDALNPAYQLLDLVPRGRDEAHLSHPMDWVRRHDDY